MGKAGQLALIASMHGVDSESEMLIASKRCILPRLKEASMVSTSRWSSDTLVSACVLKYMHICSTHGHES